MSAATVRRVALVTGAGQRVGRAIAEALAGQGWCIAAHYHRSRDGAEALCDAIRGRGGEAAAFGADLQDVAAAEGLVDAVTTRFGSLALLVNSAASMERTPLGETRAEEFDAIIALNLRAPFLLAQAASRVMPDGAVIVNIADHMAEEPWPGYVVHGVAKAGVVALTRHLAAALAPRIRVNAVSPGFVLAPVGYPEAAAQRFADETPLRRLGAPADVAEAVLYLVEAGYVTGETLHVDGGRRLRR